MRRFLGLILLGSVLFWPTPALAAGNADFPIPGGHWYSETNGFAFPTQIGYPVFDGGGIKLWSEFQRLGGVPVLGYPVSGPYLMDGFLVQAFQKAILQWRPDTGHVAFVNIFDLLHAAGKDGFLQQVRQTPPPADTAGDTGKSWAQIVAAHQALLDTNAAIKAAYFADADPLDHYGLPLTGPVDEGNVLVVRCQRAVLQQWKQAVPWAAAGQVTVANGGDIAKEAGLVPDYAAVPSGPSLLWDAVAGTPVRLDAWMIGLQLGQLPAGYTRNTPLVPGSAAPGTAAAPTANPDYIQRIEGPFASFVHPGLVNAHFVSFVQNQSATTAQGAILIENATSVYDTPADAAQDYALRMQRVQCCVPPVSVGAIGDGAVGAVFPGALSTGAKLTTYGVIYHQANVTGDVTVTYTGTAGSFDLAVQLAKASLAQIRTLGAAA
jgi:hypothetical protein